MEVEIITSSREIYKSESIDQINVPGLTGKIGILPDHVGLITPLKIGNVEITESDGQTKQFLISGGILEVHKNRIIILAEEADLPDELIAAEIENAIKKAEEQLSSDPPPSELIRIEKELQYQKFKQNAIIE